MKLHAYADIFPAMSDDDYQELKTDIAKHGQRETIKTKDGQIIDGKNRFRVCEELGKRPQFEEYEGDDLLEYVVSLNLSRRHLSTSQRAAIAVSLLPEYEKAAKIRQQAGTKQDDLSVNLREGSGKAAEIAAKTFNVGSSTIEKAKGIKRESPRVFNKVRDGKLTVNAAQKISFAKKAAMLQKPQGSKRIMVARDCFKVQYGLVDLNGNFTKGSTAKYFMPPEDSQEGIDMELMNSKLDDAVNEIAGKYEVKSKS